MKYLTTILFSFLFIIGCGEQSATTTETASTSTSNNFKQFEKIPTEQTGIDFKNTLLESFEYNYYKFQYLYNGGGVAVGDINNDGLADVYFSATMYSNQLYLNKGDFKFENITEKADVFAGGGTKTGVTMVDINNDGFLDIYVCRTGKEDQKETRSNLFYINNGDLTFTEKSKEMGLEEYCFSNHANFFDYDNDGDLDLYLMNHPTNFKKESRPHGKLVNGIFERTTTPDNPFESDRLYKNNGNGTFTDVSKQAGIVNRAFGLSVSVTDVNKDGWMDIFVANDYDEPDMFYINQKNGTFKDLSDGIFRHTSQNSMGSDFGDINNDGLQDLMVLDMLPEDNRRQKLLMTKMEYDRVEAYANNGYGYQLMRNVLQLNNGNGTFSDIGTLAGIAGTDWSWAPLMADYDNDGWKDVFITNGYRRDVTNMDFLRFTKSNFANMGQASSIYDMLNQIPSEKVHNYMYQNKGDLTFGDMSYSWGFTETTHSNGAAYADFDNDGDLDLIVNNIDAPISLYKNKGETTENQHYLQIQLEGTANNKKGIGTSVTVKTAKQSQYQEMTSTHGYFSSMPYLLHFGLGKATKAQQIIVTWQDGKTQVLENINGDQRLTIKYADANTTAPDEKKVTVIFSKANLNLGFKHKENPFVDFKREPLIPHQLSKEGPALAVGDVNGDQLEDFYVGGGAGQAGVLFLQTQNATFEKAASQPWIAESEDVDALFFDADGDKDQDLYVVSGGNAFPENNGNYQDRLYLNDGKGGFSKSENLPKLTASGGTVAAGDYDGDGDLDLFVGGRVSPGKYPYSPQSYILKNDNGKFSDVTNQVNPTLSKIGMVSDAVWQDVDSDGKIDLVVVGEWMPISVFKNDGSKLTDVTQKVGLENTQGWWNAVHLADMDDDGDLDMIAGNVGLNIRFRATASQPLEIFAKDFDGNGAIDPILTYYNKGASYPVAQKGMLVGQLKDIQKKFVYYEPYAKATLKEVFTTEQLTGALNLKATILTNTYFENQNGKFIAKTLPNDAQIAPGRAILTDDFNGDGKTDILMVGNNHNIDVESGRQDAGNGVVMLGAGNGKFNALSAMNSGFYNPKDARNMKLVKLANGKILALVANNEAGLNGFVWEKVVK